MTNSTAQSSSVLTDHYQQLKKKVATKHQDFNHWWQDHSLELADVRHLTQQVLAAASLASQIALSQPVEAQVQQKISQIKLQQKQDLLAQISAQELADITAKMAGYVKLPPGKLDEQAELYLEQQLTDWLGFEVTAQLDGQRLNHNIGIMGGEQHLKRYPSDSLANHDAYLEAGLAPNRGAFGWFTDNGQLTPQAILREKYYFAVQTLYLPDWNTNYATLKNWYKFRKMIVINPIDQLAVVGVVGDAGPALWVKKQFGGSPEVIREGKIWSRAAKGRVLLFFVDDPHDEVPLGPINLATTLALASQK